ncbi:hypothetical protein JHK85_007157 [Glycine max]|nr:hypothetical protein JHK85_007157 [Glycine max]
MTLEKRVAKDVGLASGSKITEVLMFQLLGTKEKCKGSSRNVSRCFNYNFMSGPNSSACRVEEDEILSGYIKKNGGHGSWRSLPRMADQSHKLHIDDKQLKNLTLLEIEKLLHPNQKSLKDYPTMPYPEGGNPASCLENSLILSELNYNNDQARSEFKNLFLSMTGLSSTFFCKSFFIPLSKLYFHAIQKMSTTSSTASTKLAKKNFSRGILFVSEEQD